MSLPDLLFYLFAAATLGCGFLVVANPVSRNPVTAAMFLVLTLVGLAGLFVLLHAFFLAAIQILVYAGAVMVLFLFVIMLLDPREEERRRVNRFTLATGMLAAGGVGVVLLGTLTRSVGTSAVPPALDVQAADVGRSLFTDYLLPFEMLSVLLLVAMVGVILLSRKDPE
jgi:NADH-quinone oxidoreductase subunit J